MAEKAIQEVRIVLNDALAFVASQSRAEEITNRSLDQFINEQLERLEGIEEGDPEETSGVLTSIFARSSPIAQRGQIRDVERIRSSLNQIVDAILANPESLSFD